ncbi:hypothetical protein KDL01_34060 [Actinospica durhamensis]|uniref:Uncharacterized protein n=1 Tax=Actinospica durhamensis TaxID=1508375 RepID=A0A941EV72_9ACTN|nr:hypothetical protein [Actinospica durhamensis]MBR7838345.1 hypothetical protein [Actinospica durhamensis]
MSEDPNRLLPNLRRALFLRRLRRQQAEEVPPGAVPHLNFRERRLLRAMLRRADQPWSLNVISFTFLIPPLTVVELGERLSPANLAFVRWINGVRHLVLTEVGISELPGILELYRSVRPLPVLLRHGPRAAALAWLTRHRDRAWRRRRKRELRADGASHRDDDSLLW